MSPAEDRSGVTPRPAQPVDSPTQLGLPLPPPSTTPPPGHPPPPVRGRGTAPPPADGGGARAVLAVLTVLLILAVAVTGVLAMNVFGPADEPSPTPTQLAAQSPTPVVTAGPQTPEATPAATAASTPTAASPEPVAGTPTVTPYDAQQALLGHIPPDLRDSCQLGPATAPTLATATCQADDGQILATYFLYDDERAMENAYDGFVEISAVERDSGRCSEPATWPSEGSFTIAQRPAGRVLCMQNSDAPTVYWTDSRLLVLASALHLGADAERLYEFWLREAGPSL